MTTYVALEGFDGSGKTSVAAALKKALEAQCSCVQVLGHRPDNSNQLTADLTEALKIEEVSECRFTPRVGARMRAYRLRERLGLICDDCDYIIFDRFAYTDYAMLSQDERDHYAELVTQEFLLFQRLIVFDLRADFDVLWKRVCARGPENNSPRELSGRAKNLASFQAFEAARDYKAMRLSHSTTYEVIDATQSLSAVSAMILERLLRHC